MRRRCVCRLHRQLARVAAAAAATPSALGVSCAWQSSVTASQPHASRSTTTTTTTTTTTAAAPVTLVPFPARQNPFTPVLAHDTDKVLLARAHYCLFMLAADAASDCYALYSATTNELRVLPSRLLWKAAMWIDERVGDEYIAALLFGADASTAVATALQTLAGKTQKRSVVAPDAWGITYMAFRAQQEVVQGVELPTSLDHAGFLLTHKHYDASELEPAVVDLATGAGVGDAAALLRACGVARDAVLAWGVLLAVHRRFGTPGSRKTLTPVEQIVRRVVKAVNVFVVDINVRVGKGTIAEGYTMIVTIYDVQRRAQSVHAIRTLAEEPSKLNALTTLLYGEGSSCITLFVPTARTQASQMVAFARTCRPKSPFFVAPLSGLSQHFGGKDMAKGTAHEDDPRALWHQLRSNCAATTTTTSVASGGKTTTTTTTTRKDDDRLERMLQCGCTALANRFLAQRLSQVSPAIRAAVNNIPAQQPRSDAFAHVAALVQRAREQPVPSTAQTTFLNKVNVHDAEVVLGLQQWRAKIYENEERYARECATAEARLQRYLVVDFETTTVRRYKRVSNPFTGDNHVVLSGARDYKGNVFMTRCYFDRAVALRYDDAAVTSVNYLVEGSSPRSLFLPPLDDYTVLVGHNIKFDLLHIWRDAELRRFLRNGGAVWDTMYAEYLLSGQEVKLGSGAGLDDVARSYGGKRPKLDAVKRAWAEGKETNEIAYTVLREYLHGDLENTELIFRKQCDRALQQRQVVVCTARMDGLLCTTEMEYNGLKTNVDLAQAQTNELMGKVTELRARLEDAIPGEIPADCRKFFNWASNQHLIHFFFGGKLKLNTHARESKTLPGEVFARHDLFVRDAAAYAAAQYPRGVFLRPPIHVLGIGDCAVVAGVGADKGTRVFKAYFEAYMMQAGFRKSSTMLDSLRRSMLAVPRAAPQRRGEVAPLANLLPRRHLFLLAAVSMSREGDQIVKLYVRNPVTGESVTITSPAKARELAAFVRAQVRAYTDVILPSDEDTTVSSSSGSSDDSTDATATAASASATTTATTTTTSAASSADAASSSSGGGGGGNHAAFAEAHVTIFARDACFSFQRCVNTDVSLADYFAAHSGYLSTPRSDGGSGAADDDDSTSRGAAATAAQERYSIAFADTVATLSYYKHVYSGVSAYGSGSGRGRKKATTTSTTSGALATDGGGGAGNAVVPAKALPQGSRNKASYAEAYKAKLLQEASMTPEAWCHYYTDILLHMANAALQYEAHHNTSASSKAATTAAALSSSSSSSSRSGSSAAKAKAKAAAAKRASKAKKARTASSTAAAAAATAATAGASSDSDEGGGGGGGDGGDGDADGDVPVLLRQRRAFVGYYNALPDAERKRLSLMCLVGRTVATPYDCFAVPCAHDHLVEVQLKGRLATYVPNELEAEQVMRRFRSAATRQLQVGEDTLNYFVSTHNDQTARTILELRALEKLIGTYYESTDGGGGMVSLVHDVDSCIHHELIHNKTNTGRLASANPNCQNIPKEDKSKLRDMFISRYGDKGMCIEADYSQLEVVALAVLAADEQMLEDLRNNVDFHCKRVTMMRPDLKYTEVLQRAKRNKEPEFVKLRQQAKIFSFQRQYGAGARMISKSTGLTQDQVRMLIEKENETYRGVDVFNSMVTLSANNYDAALQNGAKNVRGHQFFKGMFPVLTGSRYVFTESDVPESMLRSPYAARKSTNFSPTHLKNYPVQGFAGEIVQIMLGVLWRHFLACNNYDGLAVLTNTVHDCVWVDCHESIYRTVAKDVEGVMTSVRTVMNRLFPDLHITVDFPCDVVAGENMGSLRPIIEETTL